MKQVPLLFSDVAAPHKRLQSRFACGAGHAARQCSRVRARDGFWTCCVESRGHVAAQRPASGMRVPLEASRLAQCLGLQPQCMQDDTTYCPSFLVLVLPLLPAEHIMPVFELLEGSANTEALQALVAYVRGTWVTSNTWPLTCWSVFEQCPNEQRRRRLAPCPQCQGLAADAFLPDGWLVA